MEALEQDLNEQIIITLRNIMTSNITRIKAQEVGAIFDRFKKQVENVKKLGMAYRALVQWMTKDTFSLAETETEPIIQGFEQDLSHENIYDEAKKFKDQGNGLAVQLCFLLIDFFLLMSDGDQVIKIIRSFKLSLEPIMELGEVKLVNKVMALLEMGESEARKFKKIAVEESTSVQETDEEFVETLTYEFCSAISYLEGFLGDRNRELDSMARGLNEWEEALNRIELKIKSRQEKLLGKDELLEMRMDCAVIKMWIGLQTEE